MGNKNLLTARDIEKTNEGFLVPRLIEKLSHGYQILKPTIEFPNPLNRNDWENNGKRYSERGMISLYKRQEKFNIKFYTFPPKLENLLNSPKSYEKRLA